MLEQRRARIESVILDEASELVLRELKDPRVAPLTFTKAQLTQDGSQVTLYFTLLGGTENQDPELGTATLEGLQSARGLFRRKFAKALTVRHIPEVLFKLDRGLENVLKVEHLLRQLEKERTEAKS